MYKINTYLKNSYQLGKGPHWDDKTQTLLTVDIHKASVIRWNPLTEERITTSLPDATIGAVVPQTKSDDLMVAAKLRFATLNEKTGVATTVIEINQDKPNTRFNDAKCDPVGRLWAGTMGMESNKDTVLPKKGNLFCLERDKTVRNCLGDIGISNGLAWTSDGRKMFYVDSLKFTIEVYDYDITNGTISNPQVVATFGKEEDGGFPDGMCMDNNDNIYVAVYRGGRVVKIDPKTGQKVQVIKIKDCPKTTSVCFGGPNYEDLYVTSAHNIFMGNNLDNLPIGNSGSLFKISELGVKGLPGVSYSPQFP